MDKPKTKILLLEDELHIANLLASILEKHDFEVLKDSFRGASISGSRVHSLGADVIIANQCAEINDLVRLRRENMSNSDKEQERGIVILGGGHCRSVDVARVMERHVIKHTISRVNVSGFDRFPTSAFNKNAIHNGCYEPIHTRKKQSKKSRRSHK